MKDEKHYLKIKVNTKFNCKNKSIIYSNALSLPIYYATQKIA